MVDQGNISKDNIHVGEDEIDLIALAKTLWVGRKIIIRYTFYGVILGLVISMVSPKEFTVVTTMIPQSSKAGNSNLSGLSSLASMAGFNFDMNSKTENLSPLVYSKVVSSVPFQLELMNTTFQIAELDSPVSLFEYYIEYKKSGIVESIKKYTIGLPGILISAMKANDQVDNAPLSSEIIILSKDQEEVRKKMRDNFSLDVNDKEGLLTLSVSFPEALLTAQAALKAQNMLQHYITNYKIKKAQEQLNFVNERYTEKKNEFLLAQKKLAVFRDQNRNVSSSLARIEEEQLQSEYNITFGVYSELAKQFEQAQIQVKEDTPILTILEPVRLPIEKSKPNRTLILIVWLFIGGIIGTMVVIVSHYMQSIRKRWSDS